MFRLLSRYIQVVKLIQNIVTADFILRGDSDFAYAEVEVIALSPSKMMTKFKTDAGILFWEFINDISVKE